MPEWPHLRDEHGCTPGPCGLPPGFFRVRYFNNKPMRLADYVDEQQYHRGKMRFHNERLHGAGILCGLKVSLAGGAGLLLRVARGAAIDDCGREIVVGWDQCVDVGAWYAQRKRVARDEGTTLCQPDVNRHLAVCVLLRHAECTGGPEPAPKSRCTAHSHGGDCGCGGGVATVCGEKVEYGRVTEEFELRLVFADEGRHLAGHALFPDAGAIHAAASRAFGGTGLLQDLAEPVRERCPGGGDGWLQLACFDLVIDKDDEDRVEALVDIDHRRSSQVLLSTEVLQYLVAGLAAEVDPALGGPQLRQILFRRINDKVYEFVLELTEPVEGASLDEDSSFALRKLTLNGWSAPASNALRLQYKPGRQQPTDLDAPAIYMTLDNSESGGYLQEGGRYQLYTPAGADPVVDALLRPLRPRQLLWRFAIGRGEGGQLVMLPLVQQGGAHG